MGQWAWGMERILFIRPSLTAASLISNAHCPMPNALFPIPYSPPSLFFEDFGGLRSFAE
jgi:hypothetical protein